MTIANNSFRDNMVGGVGDGGAAIYIASGMATITDSYFTNNTARGTGGAVHVSGGTVN